MRTLTAGAQRGQGTTEPRAHSGHSCPAMHALCGCCSPPRQTHTVHCGIFNLILCFSKSLVIFFPLLLKNIYILNEALVKGSGSDTAAAVINVVQG